MSWSPYNGDEYLDFPETEAWCRDLVEAHPDWMTLVEIGTSREGRSIWLITVGDQSVDLDAQPAFWLDGGTHAAEWTGVMAVLHTLSRWAERLDAGDEETTARFKSTTAYVAPSSVQMASRPCVKGPLLALLSPSAVTGHPCRRSAAVGPDRGRCHPLDALEARGRTMGRGPRGPDVHASPAPRRSTRGRILLLQ